MKLGIATASAIALAIAVQLTVPDGWAGVLLPLLSESSETVYAPGYSWSAFRKLSKGLPQRQVRDLLGAPLRSVEHDNGETVWVYSESPVSRSYRLRAVIFDAHGNVSKVIAEFEFD